MTSFLFATLLVFGAACSSGCGDGDDSTAPDGGGDPDAGDDESPGTAEFAGASEAELLRAVQAGMGGDLTTAVFIGLLASNDLIGACLAEEVSGDTIRFSGPCSDPDGRSFRGTMTVTNLIDTAEAPYDPERVSRVELDAFAFDAPAQDGSADLFELDGWVEVDHRGTRRHGSLTFAEAGVSAHAEMDLRCDDQGGCTPAEGAMIDVRGVGTAAVTGSWVMPDDGRAGSGVVEISGVDRLSVDVGQFAAGDDGDCIAIQIDGEDAGEVCKVER